MKKFIVSAREDVNCCRVFEVVQETPMMTIQEIKSKYTHADYEQEEVAMVYLPLPQELTSRIFVKTIIRLLQEHQYEEATELISINITSIKQIYYAIFGASKEPYMEKQRRLSKVFQIASAIYDRFVTSTETGRNNCGFFYHYPEKGREPKNLYPWDFVDDFFLEKVATDLDGFGEVAFIGPLQGDCVMFTNAYCEKGFMFAKKIFKSFIPLVWVAYRNKQPMEEEYVYNPFEHDTEYFFNRFAMFIRACFGPVFYASGVEIDPEFEDLYKFVPAPLVDRE
jgi:hypothetical protein